MHRLIGVGAAAYLAFTEASPSAAQTPSEPSFNAAETAVRALVTTFGTQLRQVSLLADKEQVARGMDAHYAAYVAPELLVSWKADPDKAAGKRTSSPSPERIDIESVTAGRQGEIVVTGKVILLTAKERRDGGIFAANPVSMTVVRRNGRWLITAYEEKSDN